MPKVSFLDPLAQFDGTDRFLGHLKSSLEGKAFSKLWLAMAYAKSSGLARIHHDLKTWRALDTRHGAKLIVGIDQRGTSVQALELALDCFDEVYIAHTGGANTFHPKLSLFCGNKIGRVIVGSHNLTCGGLETNLEAGVEIDYTLPDEEAEFDAFVSSWEKLSGCSFTRQLDATLLAQLKAAGSLLDESNASERKPSPGSTAKNSAGSPIFPRVNPAPPSAIPKQTLVAAGTSGTAKKPGKPAKKAVKKGVAVDEAPAVGVAASGTRALVIQIKPHHNGEIFLSMSAVKQDPDFFRYPFNDVTVPKKGKNRGYPQRIPDPVVDITIYDKTGNAIAREVDYGLNTVYYEPKSEIRCTVSANLRDLIEQYAILHMQFGSGTTDYVMDIYNPGSERYKQLLAVCDQTMPAGGKEPARKYGWI